jgi:hypothetical protein
MLIYALNFLLGISVFSFKNTLEISNNEWSVILCGFFVILALFKRYKLLALNGLIFLLGFAWMGWFSTQNLNTHVDDIYLNQSILVTGVIADLPEASTDKTKFIFYANSPPLKADLNSLGMAKIALICKRVMLGNYNSNLNATMATRI